MRILLRLGMLLSLVPAAVFGGPCLPGTLQDYLNLGFDNGCEINGRLFQNFELAPIPFGSTEIDPQQIAVTPIGISGSSSLLFTLNTVSGPGQWQESFFRFNVVGGAIGASIRLGNPLAAGNGAVTGILDVCVNGLFLGIEPIGCDSGNSVTAIAFAVDSFQSVTERVSFAAPTSFFDVFVDLGIDGGPGGVGFASLESAEVGFLAPEPSTLLLIGAGLIVFSIVGVRRDRRSH